MRRSGAISESTQQARWTDLWATCQSLGIVDGLILFCITNYVFPDNPALPLYSTTNVECWLGLWHTGSGVGDLGSARPAVSTITALPAITV